VAKRPRMARPQPLACLLPTSLHDLGLADRLREAEIWRVWSDVVGEALAARTQPVRIIDGILTVAVSSAPWMQELRFMTGAMKEKLNSRLGGDIVCDIVLKAGRVDRPVAEPPLRQSLPKKLTSVQKKMIEQHSAAIADPDTRQAFVELMTASMEYPSTP